MLVHTMHMFTNLVTNIYIHNCTHYWLLLIINISFCLIKLPIDLLYLNIKMDCNYADTNHKKCTNKTAHHYFNYKGNKIRPLNKT